MKKALSLSLSLSLSQLKPTQLNRALFALFLACVMAVGSILPMFAVPQAQASAAGRLYGWGRNDSYQVGNQPAHVDVPTRLPNPPAGLTDWNDFDFYVGGAFTLVRSPDGRLFGWGQNNWGQLGQGPGNISHQHTPQELLASSIGLTSWNDVEIFVGASSTFARTPNGNLWVWGQNESGQLGLGPANMNHQLSPVQNTNLPAGVSNWNDVEFILGGNHTFVRTATGELFGWGINHEGRLAAGDFDSSPSPRPISSLPGTSNWNGVEIFAWGMFNLARTSDGRLFGWGRNVEHQLGLGLGDTANRHTPQELLASNIGLTNWNDVDILQGWTHTFVITPAGELWGWGENFWGNMGNGTGGPGVTQPVPINISISGISSLDTSVSTWNDIELVTGNHHMLAITPAGRMFAWGINDGHLGLGSGFGNFVNTPTENTNLPQGVRDWNDFDFFTASHHTFARVRPLAPIPITKTLRLNEGTIVPGTEMPLNTPAGKVSDEASFTFRFVQRPAVRISDDPIRYSHAQVPAIANQTITIDPNTATAPVNGVFTATGNTVCIRALVYAHNPFPAGSVFVWEVYEIEDSSGLHDYPCVQIVYDTSRYQIRAHSNSAGIIEIIEVFEMERDVQNNWQIVLPKLGATPFTNIYTRLVGDEGLPLHNALLISKEVEGEMADLTTQFDFTLTLTNPVLTPPVVGDGTTGPVIAQVVQRGTTTPVSPPRTVAIAPGANSFFLRHNESLLIPQLPAGTRFQVTEDAHLHFAARATITALTSGTYPPASQDPVPNTALVTGTYIIHQVNNNTAAFTNIHQWDTPTGLFITSTPWVALGAAALLAGLLATSRNRRRIEELPMVL